MTEFKGTVIKQKETTLPAPDLSYLKEEVVKNNTIDPKFYEQFDVKRGLRNSDGSGVLAGLSQISSVVGFKKEGEGLTPVDGILNYRGISLADLLSQFSSESRFCYEKVCFLLLVGRMPNDEEYKDFILAMQQHRHIPQLIIESVIKAVPSHNVMNKIQTAISALYAFDGDADSLDAYENFSKSIKLLSQIPILVAYAYLAAFKPDAELVRPTGDMSVAESFLYVLREGKMPTKMEAHILDISLILHAEHGGGNNSTFATYVVSSSGSDIYSTLAAAVASLKGPLHGAANKKVMEMMADIKKNVKSWTDESEIKAYITKIVQKKAHDKSGKIFGLGHAVYTKSDPRAVAIKALAEPLAKETGREDELTLYKLIEKLGPVVFEEVKGAKKVISPNVDFFSGFVYDCLNIPQEIYTPIFAMSRACGWCSHRIEEGLSGKRIIRPGYKFVS